MQGRPNRGMAPRTLSAGVVVVFADPAANERWQFLILRSFRYWDFPKGTVEAGEDPLAAAKREVAEEAAIVELDFAWGLGFRETLPYRAGKVARYYIARAATQEVELLVNPALGRAEHEEYRWLEFLEARQILVPRLVDIIDWAGRVIGERPSG